MRQKQSLDTPKLIAWGGQDHIVDTPKVRALGGSNRHPQRKSWGGRGGVKNTLDTPKRGGHVDPSTVDAFCLPPLLFHIHRASVARWIVSER